MKKTFLCPMTARNNILWTALRMASQITSLFHKGLRSLSNRKQWIHQLFASLSLIFSRKMGILTDHCSCVLSVLAISRSIHPSIAYEFASWSLGDNEHSPTQGDSVYESTQPFSTSFWESVKYWKISKRTLFCVRVFCCIQHSMFEHLFWTLKMFNKKLQEKLQIGS